MVASAREPTTAAASGLDDCVCSYDVNSSGKRLRNRIRPRHTSIDVQPIKTPIRWSFSTESAKVTVGFGIRPRISLSRARCSGFLSVKLAISHTFDCSA